MTSAGVPRTRVLLERVELVALCVMSALMTWPLWSVAHPPIQDMPQHLAAISVLHHYNDPQWGFAQHFTLDLSHTQYLAYYALVHVLSYVWDLELANRIVMSGCIIALPLALRSLSRALGFEGRAAWLALPLTYNAQLILGFFNFLLAIPLALYGLSLAVRMRRVPFAWPSAAWLSVVMLACFYAHVVPFAFLGLGVAMLALRGGAVESARRLLPVMPSVAAALIWVRQTPAGQATLHAAQGQRGGAVSPVYRPWQVAWTDLPNWLTDILHKDKDLLLLKCWVVLAGVVCVLGVGSLWRHRAARDVVGMHAWRLLWLLVPLACVGYFVLPSGYTWIWPIAERFALLSAVLFCALVPWPRGVLGYGLVAAAIALSVAHVSVVQQAFARFEQNEVADFDAALAAIPRAQKVAGLIFARGSSEVKLSPFIHYVAYYQARKGGVVMFTFADFPQSPFKLRPVGRPPAVPPRWEWMPERVDPQAQLSYYDYVLVRGGPGRIARQAAAFAPVYRGKRWSVWRRLVAPSR